ncbi:AAA domain-containing protein [Thermocrinis sp.]
MINDVIHYLKYLKELSKKIGIRVDFRNLISGNKRRMDRGYLQENFIILKEDFSLGEKVEISRLHNEMLYNFLKGKVLRIKQYDDKALFLGIGIVKYFSTKNNGKRETKVFAPVFVVSLDVEEKDKSITLGVVEEKDKSITLGVREAFLNYDLFDELPWSSDPEDYVAREEILDFIKETEEKLELCEDVKSIKELALEVARNINKIFQLEEEIEIIEEETSIEVLLQRQSSYYCNVAYIFFGNSPPELSTYKSLELLIEELKEKRDLKNETLRKILTSALAERIELGKIDNFSLGDWEFYLPLPLSENQKIALENALNYEVSYIQGPPGTGKSHTITALALLCLLLDKKVLIVSQKPPAIEVLFEKISQILGNNDITPFIYFYKEYKRKTKENIQNILNTAIRISRDLDEDLRLLNLDLEKKISVYKNILLDYKHYLNLVREYSKTTEDFEKKLNRFDEFSESIKNLFRKGYGSHKNLKIFLGNQISTFKVLEKRGFSRLYEFRRRRLFEAIKKFCPKFDYSKIRKLNTSYFAESLYDLLDTYDRLINTKSKIQAHGELGYNEKLTYLENEIREIAKKRLRTLCLARIYKRAKEYKEELSNLKSIFHYTSERILKGTQSKMDYEKILKVFNVWIMDIPSVDRVLPMKPNLFDFVVVDEASQVNLAQIIPVFYRGRRICVVGDHKQLNLEAVGLGFRISNKLDLSIWEKYKPANLPYEEAKRRRLVLTKSSILDFLSPDESSKNSEVISYINEEAKVMLNEHFRSVHPLASFTSKKFYENKLYIMTKNPNREGDAFKAIKVEGRRHQKYNIVDSEVEEVIRIIRNLKENRKYRDVLLPEYVPERFSIGVLSFTRDQVEHIKFRIIDEGYEDILVGTPEEFQGHEKDIMIISLGLDDTCSRSKTHYENTNRFNVATSRAKYFTFLVYAGIPENFSLTNYYLAHFGQGEKLVKIPEGKLDRNKFESKLEEVIYEYLREIIEEIQQKFGIKLEIYNQYQTCGYRLDFVIHCKANKRFLALEVDGPHHYEKNGNNTLEYADWHVERVERLKRAGWKIIHTPYYKWYINGWLDKESGILKDEIQNLKERIIHNLELEL